MLVGHYGPAFALKGQGRAIPLWLLFVAVQWLDILWAVFVYLGIEKLRIVRGFNASNDLDLYYMPITHSLPGALALSALLGAIVAVFFKGDRSRVFWVIAAAVFSHWVLDLIVHVHDLSLWDDSYKVGFGLWRYFWPALILEFVVLIGGAWWYARAMPSARPRGDIALWLFVGFLMLVYLAVVVMPPQPGATRLIASELLAVYAISAALAALVERLRR